MDSLDNGIENIANDIEDFIEKDYINIDNEGNIRGFLNNKIHSKIPDTALEITKEIKKYIQGTGKKMKIKDITSPIDINNLEEIIEPDIDIPIDPIEQLRADVDFLMIMEGYANV